MPCLHARAHSWAGPDELLITLEAITILVDLDEAQVVREDIQLASHALDALDGEILPMSQEKPVAVCMLPPTPKPASCAVQRAASLAQDIVPKQI